MKRTINPVPRPSAAYRPEPDRVVGRTWYRIAAAATPDGGDEPPPEEDVTAIYLYDMIGGWGIFASDFVRDLSAVRSSKISLHVNSPGGDVFDGIAIMAALAAHPATVTAHVDSLAASIASVITLGADHVVMGRHAEMMIHDASGVGQGNAAEMRDFADLLDRISENIASVYAEKAGGQKRTWRNLMKAETWYSGPEAVAAGLADELAPSPVKKKEPAPADAADPELPEPDEAPEPPEPEEPGEQQNRDRRWVHAGYRYGGRLAAPAPEIPAATAGARPAAQAAMSEYDPELIRNAIRKAAGK